MFLLLRIACFPNQCAMSKTSINGILENEKLLIVLKYHVHEYDD